MLSDQRGRVVSIQKGAAPTKEELEVLECFWNPHFHTMRDWVPLIAIVDTETQKLTSRHDCAVAQALVRARVEALIKIGLTGSEVLERLDGTTSTAKLWLTTDGAMHFATGFPKALRNPLRFAKRHLTLLQLIAVVVTVVFAIATFVARIIGWVG
jgi:hypothetical protein